MSPSKVKPQDVQRGYELLLEAVNPVSGFLDGSPHAVLKDVDLGSCTGSTVITTLRNLDLAICLSPGKGKEKPLWRIRPGGRITEGKLARSRAINVRRQKVRQAAADERWRAEEAKQQEAEGRKQLLQRLGQDRRDEEASELAEFCDSLIAEIPGMTDPAELLDLVLLFHSSWHHERTQQVSTAAANRLLELFEILKRLAVLGLL